MADSRVTVVLRPAPGGTALSSGIYIPGDEVSGTVQLFLHKETKVNAIIVQFRGTCETRIDLGRNSVQWKSAMFDVHKTLLQGGVRMFPGTYEYPFTFRFPGTFTAGLDASFSRDNGLFSHPSGRLPLPPSCSGSTHDGAFSIAYSIIAVSPRPMFNWKFSVNLPFIPCRTEAFPDPAYAFSRPTLQPLQHFKLGYDGLPRALRTREAMKNSIHHSDDVSTLKFTLRANAPTVIVPGNPHPIELTLQILSNQGHTDIMPEFRAKYIGLCLKPRTDLRASATFADSTATVKGEITLGSIRADTLLPFNTPKVLNGLLTPRRTTMFAVPIPPPSFKSVAVARQYSMQLMVIIHCLGEEHKFKISWWNVTVHSARMEPGIEEAINVIRSGRDVPAVTVDDGEGRRDDGEQPPSYEETQTQGERLPAYAP